MALVPDLIVLKVDKITDTDNNINFNFIVVDNENSNEEVFKKSFVVRYSTKWAIGLVDTEIRRAVQFLWDIHTEETGVLKNPVLTTLLTQIKNDITTYIN